MYEFISTISLIIRQFILPNPYESIFTNTGLAAIFNIIIGGIILHFLSRTMTGIFYRTRECPSLGSIMYLFWYIINLIIVTVIGTCIRKWQILIVVFILVYILIYIMLFALKKISDKSID